jgi:predicted acetyltransferase
MVRDELSLADPSLALADSFWALIEDFRSAGEANRIAGGGSRLASLARVDLPDFIGELEAQARGVDLPPGLVPSSYYWLVRPQDGAILGVGALRHHLTPALEDVGGHIGYSIRPSERRKGYGTRILALTLDKARARGLDRVLVTCDTENVGSAHIIERNGGILASAGHSDRTGTYVSRYWIHL